MNNLVSIITPTYNCGKYIFDTIESVINQSYLEWEMIIIDDCSTDNTKDIVSQFVKADSRIKYYLLETNQGAAIARNFGLAHSNGKYIAFLDSDDLWMPEKLTKQINFMEQNNLAFTCTSYRQINEDGIMLDKIISPLSKANYNRVLLDCPIGNSTVIFNREKLGEFNVPNIRKRNDDALWLKILKKEKYIFGLKEVLMVYRIRKNSISRNKIKLLKYHWYLYRKIEKLSLIRSLFHINIWILIKVFRIK
jgi:teichuronic acid biosynthesis glycosyltransferase TuaG